MSKRFVIMPRDDYSDAVHHEFVLESRAKAIHAFRTLYGEQPQYVLFEQVAVTDSEPAGSRDEADNSGREARLLKEEDGSLRMGHTHRE